jgi:hypothetical protein
MTTLIGARCSSASSHAAKTGTFSLDAQDGGSGASHEDLA